MFLATISCSESDHNNIVHHCCGCSCVLESPQAAKMCQKCFTFLEDFPKSFSEASLGRIILHGGGNSKGEKSDKMIFLLFPFWDLSQPPTPDMCLTNPSWYHHAGMWSRCFKQINKHEQHFLGSHYWK